MPEILLAVLAAAMGPAPLGASRLSNASSYKKKKKAREKEDNKWTCNKANKTAKSSRSASDATLQTLLAYSQNIPLKLSLRDARLGNFINISDSIRDSYRDEIT